MASQHRVVDTAGPVVRGDSRGAVQRVVGRVSERPCSLSNDDAGCDDCVDDRGDDGGPVAVRQHRGWTDDAAEANDDDDELLQCGRR